VDLIQLRDKQAEAGPLLAAAAVLRAAADRHGALFAVNDRADVALAAGADVLHLGQDDLPLPWARRILGDDVLLGRSTHDPGQAARAAAEPWDYLVAGPVWATATKPGRPATGTALLEAVAALDPPQPWFAIGGIDLDNLDQVTAAGATRVVVVRAITTAPDPAFAARTLRERLT
jgi:thiamine-phosphate pyrophosphorylase